MQRQIAKQFGIDLSAAINAWGVPIVASTSNPFGLLGRALSDASGVQVGNTCPLATGVTTHLCAGGVLKALEEVGLIHTLAEPNLTAVSGETARFLAGGEFPVPGGRDQQGNVQIIFKQFGVGLSFTPVVLSENRISLQISTEVSELTNTGAFTLNGTTITDPSTGQTVTAPGLTIPALNVRRAQTTVELPSGGSFAIAGLLQHTTKQQIDAFPGLKDMPVLGALFRSRDYQNNETELVVLVSTYLVKPTSEKRLASPTDGFVPPSDAETILLGHLNAEHPPAPDGLKSAGNTKLGFIVQ
jgi:pilus assembly protein CpaC